MALGWEMITWIVGGDDQYGFSDDRYRGAAFG